MHDKPLTLEVDAAAAIAIFADALAEYIEAVRARGGAASDYVKQCERELTSADAAKQAGGSR